MSESTHGDYQRLIREAKQGGKDSALRRNALEQLFVLVYPRAVHYADWKTGGNRARADDLVQNAFVLLIAKIDTLDDSRDVFPWIAAAIRNFDHNWRKRRDNKVAQLSQQDFVDREEWDPSQHEKEPDQESEAIRECAKNLSQRLKATYDLVYKDGVPDQEAAETLGIRPGTVRAHKTRIKESLRECLDKHRVSRGEVSR